MISPKNNSRLNFTILIFCIIILSLSNNKLYSQIPASLSPTPKQAIQKSPKTLRNKIINDLDSIEKVRQKMIVNEAYKWMNPKELLKSISLNEYKVDANNLINSKYSKIQKRPIILNKIKAKTKALADADSIYISNYLQKATSEKNTPLIKVIDGTQLKGHVYNSITGEGIQNAFINNGTWANDVATNAKGDFEKWINIHNTDSVLLLEIRAENYLPYSVKIPITYIKEYRKFALVPKKIAMPPPKPIMTNSVGEKEKKELLINHTSRNEYNEIKIVQNKLVLYNNSKGTFNMADIKSITDSLNSISTTLQSIAKIRMDTTHYALQSTVNTISNDQSYIKGEIFVLIGLVSLFMTFFILLFNRVNTISDNVNKTVSDLSSIIASLKTSVDGLGEMKNSIEKIISLQKDIEYLKPLQK